MRKKCRQKTYTYIHISASVRSKCLGGAATNKNKEKAEPGRPKKGKKANGVTERREQESQKNTAIPSGVKPWYDAANGRDVGKTFVERPEQRV